MPGGCRRCNVRVYMYMGCVWMYARAAGGGWCRVRARLCTQRGRVECVCVCVRMRVAAWSRVWGLGFRVPGVSIKVWI